MIMNYLIMQAQVFKIIKSNEEFDSFKEDALRIKNGEIEEDTH